MFDFRLDSARLRRIFRQKRAWKSRVFILLNQREAPPCPSKNRKAKSEK
jgi:hypothetical protein